MRGRRFGPKKYGNLVLVILFRKKSSKFRKSPKEFYADCENDTERAVFDEKLCKLIIETRRTCI